MTKVLDATCAAGIVKFGLIAVPGTVILSEGVGPSEGVLVIEGEKKTYVAKTSPDLKSTLDQLVTALDKIASTLTTVSTALTSIGAGMTGSTTAQPPTLAANVSSITANVVLINAAKTQLTTLKAVLK